MSGSHIIFISFLPTFPCMRTNTLEIQHIILHPRPLRKRNYNLGLKQNRNHNHGLKEEGNYIQGLVISPRTSKRSCIVVHGRHRQLTSKERLPRMEKRGSLEPSELHDLMMEWTRRRNEKAKKTLLKIKIVALAHLISMQHLEDKRRSRHSNSHGHQPNEEDPKMSKNDLV